MRTCISCKTPISWAPAECVDCRWPEGGLPRDADLPKGRPSRPKPPKLDPKAAALARRMKAIAKQDAKRGELSPALRPPKPGSAREMWMQGKSLEEIMARFGVGKTKAHNMARRP